MVGIVLMTVSLAGILYGMISSRIALWQFDNAQAKTAERDTSTSNASKNDEQVDFSLWDEKRIRGYQQSLLVKTDAPLAVLLIPKLRIRVPVYDGTDELNLNRGVGRIIGTAKPGSAGNIGIAGHRDGFFRGLKDISISDEVDLELPDGKAIYVVEQIEIVNPADVRVLKARDKPSLTLVTCFPFYFVGDAPNRFVVHASLVPERERDTTQSTSISPSTTSNKEKTK